MELIIHHDFLVFNLTTSTYEKITLVYCIRTQLPHGLRAKTKRPSRDGATSDKKVHHSFNGFNTNKKGSKDSSKGDRVKKTIQHKLWRGHQGKRKEKKKMPEVSK
jgi:hypothetical protein